MAKQLGFDLPSKPALGRADFLVAPSNAVAVQMIENWKSWNSGKLVLTGPDGSGKTHLAHVWTALSDGEIVKANTLAKLDIPALASRNVAVEDVPNIADDTIAQTALFHLHNLILAEGHALLLTGRKDPQRWGLTLPDLASRVTGTHAAKLSPPDDALLAAVLAKLFSDRQIVPKPDVIPYLVRRIERSFANARETVERLDAASLAEQRPVTRKLAASVLDGIVIDKS